MTKQTILALAVGLFIGVGGTYALSNADENKSASNDVHTHSMTSTNDHNAQATAKLKDLKGDDFDKAFIEEMIMHHQGAIEMAKLIETNANHDELKRLGQDIISAQSKEIDMMQTWQTDWGYKTTQQSHNMHGM